MFAKVNRETPYLSKKDRKVLAETAKRVFLSRNPNPERKGCPDPSVLRNLAFHKPPKDAMEVTLHLSHCSDCFRDAMGYSQEFKESRRRFWFRIGTAAAVALVVGALYFGIKGFNLSRPPERIANTPSVAPNPVRPAPVTPSTTEVAKAETPLPIVDFHLPLVTRGPETGTPAPKTLTLSRERLLLRIHLPFGSDAGTYEVRFHRLSDKRQLLKYERTADKGNAYTLNIEDDFSKLDKGPYILAVFAPGIIGEIQGYPVRIADSQGH
jgi:hypothetical protein